MSSVTEEIVPSSFRPPDPKKALSVRVRSSTHAKLRALVDIWRTQLEADGREDAAKEVDVTYAVDILLAAKLDDELAQWGGLPSNPEALARVLKDVRAQAKASKQ